MLNSSALESLNWEKSIFIESAIERMTCMVMLFQFVA